MEREGFVYQHPFEDSVTVGFGRERVSISGAMLNRVGGFERVCAELYDAAKRDVCASMSPLRRPQPRVIRSGNRSTLAHPLRPGCSRTRNHGA